MSNTNKKDKVENVSKELGIPYINFAKKPFKKGFLKAQKELNIEDSRQIASVRRPNIYGCFGRKKSKYVFNTYKTY